MTAYAVVWGLGGNLDAASRDSFDQAARKLLNGSANYPAGAGTVFDYRLDVKRLVPAGPQKPLDASSAHIWTRVLLIFKHSSKTAIVT
jgi:hypothetical protein